MLTPQIRTTISPRLDYAINANNKLVVRYQDTRAELDKQGMGDFNLASRAFDQSETENTVQVTETMVLSARAINETRFQYMRTKSRMIGDNTVPAIERAGRVLERRRRRSGTPAPSIISGN